MGLNIASAGLTLVGKHPTKMSIAEKCGVRGVLVGDVEPSMYGSFDVVVEASGSESGFAVALDLVRPRGKVVLKSTFHGTPTWPASRIVVDEITVVGSRCGRFGPALEALSTGAVDVSGLIDDVMPLSQGVDAMKIAAEKGRLKLLLDPRGKGN